MERAPTVDRGGHVDPAEVDALIVRHRLVRVEIDEGWKGNRRRRWWEEHDGGAVRDAARSQEMDAGVPACDLGKVGERICRGAEEEPGHIDTEDCEKDLSSNHFVVNDRCCSVRRWVGFNF